MIISNLMPPDARNKYHQEHVIMMLENLKKWTGYDLIQEYGFSLETLGEQVFYADFYILSHDRSTDPLLNYANQRVLDLWEVSWSELTRMHSRETAKSIDRDARSAIMAEVKANNYINGYSGVRISKTGKEFKILDGTVWNLYASTGDFCGQAAWFKQIQDLGEDRF
jgi:MEKHLA domain